MATARHDSGEPQLCYKQLIAPGLVSDSLKSQVINNVKCELSRQASEKESQAEFYSEVDIHVRETSIGGLEITGTLDRPPVADYFTRDVPPEEYIIGVGKKAADADPTDFDADEYERHLREKALRPSQSAIGNDVRQAGDKGTV